jgi:1-deoxy-D-xylulose-5-phosphate synthase
VDEAVIGAAREHRLIATVEDNGRAGGFGDAVGRLLRDHDVDVPVKTFGLPQEFLDHGNRPDILATAGLTPQHLARQITEAVARRTPEAATPESAADGAAGTVRDAHADNTPEG